MYCGALHSGAMSVLFGSRRLAIAAFVIGLSLAPVAQAARPGGGHGFGGASGGGGGHGGGGGGGGGGHGIVDNPVPLSGAASVGLVLFVLGIVGVIALFPRGTVSVGEDDDEPLPPVRANRHPNERAATARKRLRDLVRFDPAFSLPVFEDFSSALYTESVRASGSGESARLEAYLSPEVAKTLASDRPLSGVTTVLLGAMTIVDVSDLDGPSDKVSVELSFEAVHSRADDSGAEESVYVGERWVLRRRKEARSRTPEKARVFGCPRCSAPLEVLFAGKCRYCEENVATGAFDWVVCSVRVDTSRNHGPLIAVGSTSDSGVSGSRVSSELARISKEMKANGTLDPSALNARVAHVFSAFREAWTSRDLSATRGLLSEAFLQTQEYWVSEYRRQGLRNVLDESELVATDLVRLETDRYYDLATLHVRARAKDYVVDESGSLVAGDSVSRSYGEYWTFVRARPIETLSASATECPRCGAPLVSEGREANRCKSCDSEVHRVSFDWVLSRIEQEDVYAG